MVTGQSTGHPVRVIKNKFAKKFKSLEDDNATVEELEKFGQGALRNAVMGDADNGSVMAGQVAGLVNKRESVESIIKDLLDGFEKTKSRVNEV